jgi:hypothetical protein
LWLLLLFFWGGLDLRDVPDEFLNGVYKTHFYSTSLCCAQQFAAHSLLLHGGLDGILQDVTRKIDFLRRDSERGNVSESVEDTRRQKEHLTVIAFLF